MAKGLSVGGRGAQNLRPLEFPPNVFSGWTLWGINLRENQGFLNLRMDPEGTRRQSAVATGRESFAWSYCATQRTVAAPLCLPRRSRAKAGWGVGLCGKNIRGVDAAARRPYQY